MKHTKLFIRTLIVGITLGGALLLSAPVAHAGETTEKTAFSFNNKQGDVGIKDLFVEVLRFLSAGVGIAVVAGIAIGGIKYSTSQGNPAGAQQGITIITNAVIALILYLLMFALLQFLVPGGVIT